MRKCLRESALLLLFEGEGTGDERAHLEACETCGDRYRRLVGDLQVVDQVLRGEPPRQPLRRSSRFLHRRWVPAVAALALMLVSVWGVMRVERKGSVAPEETRSEDVALFLEEASTPIFAQVDDGLVGISYPESDFSYLETALGGDGTF